MTVPSGELATAKPGPATSPTPLLSVAMITYNHAPFLAEAIEGVLAQRTSFPIEFVIGEDCSTDDTRKVALDYQARYPDLIRLIPPTPNVGVNENFKRTIEACKGRYIAYCEGDDLWGDPAKLQKQVDFLEANPQYVICYHDSLPFDEKGRINFDFGGARRDLTARELQEATPIFTLTVCFRNVIREWPREFLDARIADTFFWAMLGEHGEGKFLPDIYPAHYRVHAGGIMSSASRQQRYRLNLTSLCALFLWHQRMGREDLADFFVIRIIRNAAAMLGMRRFMSEVTTLGVQYQRALRRNIDLRRLIRRP